VVDEQPEVEADLPHVLRFVHDQRRAPSDERAQPGHRLALEILAHVDVLPRHEQRVRVVLPHVLSQESVVLPTRRGP